MEKTEKMSSLRLLLVVGTANDIFIYNMAKWLKATMDVELDVFEFWPAKQQAYDSTCYDRLYSASKEGWAYRRPQASFTAAYATARQLRRFLKGRCYDIIHCHWLSAPAVLAADTIKRHCGKLFVTFWGGELEQQQLLRSHGLYLRRLSRMVAMADAMVNSETSRARYLKAFPQFKGTFFAANLGSSPLESLYALMEKTPREAVKRQWNIPEEKTSVLIGYSGKELHRHGMVIEAFRRHPELAGRIHLLAPMTRSSDPAYVAGVEAALAASGYSYTLVRDRFLTDGEMASLRYATDVVFQCSRFDGFSRSIIECLCARAIVCYGSWLDYEPYLKQYGFEAIRIDSAEEGVKKLVSVLQFRGMYDEMLERNSRRGRSHFLWSECIGDWVDAYKTFMR